MTNVVHLPNPECTAQACAIAVDLGGAIGLLIYKHSLDPGSPSFENQVEALLRNFVRNNGWKDEVVDAAMPAAMARFHTALDASYDLAIRTPFILARDAFASEGRHVSMAVRLDLEKEGEDIASDFLGYGIYLTARIPDDRQHAFFEGMVSECIQRMHFFHGMPIASIREFLRVVVADMGAGTSPSSPPDRAEGGA